MKKERWANKGKDLLSWCWDIVIGQHCVLCHKERVPHINFKGVCLECYRKLERKAHYIELRGLDLPLITCGYFESEWANLLKAFKFENQYKLSTILAHIFFKNWGEWCIKSGIEVIIPVPSSRQKMYYRGYNQSELIAQSLSKKVGVPMDKECIVRVHQKKSQIECSQSERFFNVNGCFKVKIRNRGRRPIYQQALLIDDTVTTGATISEAKKELEINGIVEHCRLASLAYTVP